MELTKKALEDVKFRSRGKWYDGGQVDAFLDELAVAAETAQRELTETRSRGKALSQQVEALQEEKQALLVKIQALEEQGKETLEKKQERDRLIQDIKALRAFRETFRNAVEQDAASLSEQMKQLDSDKLL